MSEILQQWGTIIWSLAFVVGAIILGFVIHYLLFSAVERVAGRTHTILDDSFAKNCRRPIRLLIPLLVVGFILPLLAGAPMILVLLRHMIIIGVIVSVAWLLVRMTYVLDDIVLSRYKIEVKDNLQARKILTQLQVFKRIVIVIVSVLALVAILMSFEKVRHIGTGLLASAGIVGIILGLSAQRTITTLLAGLQIAITQPFRVDDVVIVENEWGRIEEITFTYVVVRIWDLRRLVLPITYFIEKPFQNWTRVTADILGTVFLYVDYTVPVQTIREELHRILKGSGLWNGNVWGLQVTNATERTVELRALMSASDASTAWNLRCEVREKLIAHIQKNYPDGLPKVRAEFHEKRGGELLPGGLGLEP
jgi:small-conductance mechanosensitive channel